MKTITMLLGLVMCCFTSLLAQPATTNTAPSVLPRRTPRTPVEAPPLPSPGAATTTAQVRTNLPVKPLISAAVPPSLPTPAVATPPDLTAPPAIPPLPSRSSRQVGRTGTNLANPKLAVEPVALPIPPQPGAAPPSVTPLASPPPMPPLPGSTPPIPASPNPTQSLVTAAPPASGPESTNIPAVGAKGINALGSGTEEIFPAGLIRFQDADLIQVLDLYQELTGKTVLRPANLPAAKITIRSQTELTRREAIQALDSILSMNAISMTPQGDKFIKAILEAQLQTSAMKFNPDDPLGLPESGTPVWQVVRITNALPGDVAKALSTFAKAPNSILAIDAANVLILRDYAENVKRMMEVIAKIDVMPVDEIKSVVIPIKYALASDIAQVLSSLTTGGGGGAMSVGKQTTRSGLTGAGGGGGMGGMGGMGNNPNQPYGSGMGGSGGLGGMGASGAGRSSFANQLQKIVNRAASGDIVVLGTTKIIADERTNSLLIFASRQDLTQISNIIAQLDVVLAQVLIEALIFEVALNSSLDYGISYLQKQPSMNGPFTGIGALNNTVAGKPWLTKDAFTAIGSNSVPGGFSYLAQFGKDLDVTATAIAGDSRFNVLSRPRIQTSHAVEANLFVGRTRPYPTGTSYGGGYGGYGGGYSQIQQLQIGITLSVLPLINPDGLVVMDIRQRTQSVGNEIEIANVGKVPETIDREANAKVAVRNRETIVLGGFISAEKKKSSSGIPLLKDIPILGNLFRSTSRSQDRQELMILIRPTVLPTPTDASAVVAEEKRAMPGIAAAEKEFKEGEEKRLKADNKDLYKREGFRQ